VVQLVQSLDEAAALASDEWKAALAHVGKMRGRRIAVMGEERVMFDEKVIGATR